MHLQSPPYLESPVKCMFIAATEGLVHIIPKNATAEAKSFMEICLEQDPAKRISAQEASQHPWVHRMGLSQGIQKIISSAFLGDTLALFN